MKAVPLKQLLCRLLGLLLFGAGLAGIVVPLLPTVPLWILAALCFAQGSPAWQRRIYAHPRFGETVRLFVEEGALTRRGKYFAMAGAAGSSALSLWLLQPPQPVSWSVAAMMSLVVLWLYRRPEPAASSGG